MGPYGYGMCSVRDGVVRIPTFMGVRCGRGGPRRGILSVANIVNPVQGNSYRKDYKRYVSRVDNNVPTSN